MVAGPIQPLNREAIYSALFKLVWAAYSWKNDATTARRLLLFDAVPPERRPALFQFEGGDETITYPARPNVKRVLPAALIIYASCKDPKTIGSSIINPLIDAVEAALLPLYGDAMGLGGQNVTLGGLVRSVRIEGKILRVPGDVDGDALVHIPVVIECP